MHRSSTPKNASNTNKALRGSPASLKSPGLWNEQPFLQINASPIAILSLSSVVKLQPKSRNEIYNSSRANSAPVTPRRTSPSRSGANTPITPRSVPTTPRSILRTKSTNSKLSNGHSGKGLIDNSSHIEKPYKPQVSFKESSYHKEPPLNISPLNIAVDYSTGLTEEENSYLSSRTDCDDGGGLGFVTVWFNGYDEIFTIRDGALDLIDVEDKYHFAQTYGENNYYLKLKVLSAEGREDEFLFPDDCAFRALKDKGVYEMVIDTQAELLTEPSEINSIDSAISSGDLTLSTLSDQSSEFSVNGPLRKKLCTDSDISSGDLTLSALSEQLSEFSVTTPLRKESTQIKIVEPNSDDDEGELEVSSWTQY
eukprot:Colp12_sorted_trinity150504_noHs@28983